MCQKEVQEKYIDQRTQFKLFTQTIGEVNIPIKSQLAGIIPQETLDQFP